MRIVSVKSDFVLLNTSSLFDIDEWNLVVRNSCFKSFSYSVIASLYLRNQLALLNYSWVMVKLIFKIINTSKKDCCDPFRATDER